MVILFFLGVLTLIVLGARHRNRQAPLVLPPPDERSPTELAADDPVEALLRYGTPDDAARLKEQGVDLGELGYRPPRDE